MHTDAQLKWFAARAIRDRHYVLRFLELEGVQYQGIADIKTLLFLHCTRSQLDFLRSELWDRMLFYKDSRRVEPEPVPDQVMKTFFLLAPFHDEPVIYLSVDDPKFFEGKRKRVTGGVFAGCEGVIKRIKGERRLIVRINDRAALATPYIRRELLEDV